MKTTLLDRVLVGILLVVAGGIVLHAPLTVWLGTSWPDYSLLFKAWKEILMGAALVLLIIIAAQRKLVGALLDDRFMQIGLIYAGLHLVTIALLQYNLQAAGAGLLIDLRYVLYFILVYGTIRLLPQYRSLFLKTFAAGAVVVIVFGLMQLFVLPRDFLALIGYSKETISPFLTVDENPAFIRISSTLRGPNPLGAYLVIALSLIVAFAIKYGRKLKRNQIVLLGALAVGSGIVLGASYSRSSVIGLVIALIIIVVSVTSKNMRKQIGIGLLVGAIVASIGLVAFRNNEVISSVIWHDSPTTGARIDSNEGHSDSLIDGFARVIRQPLGSGVGSTGSASLVTDSPLIIENHYLFVAHEVGWFGLVLFLFLFFEVMRQLWLRRAGALALGVFASGCGLAVIGLLLPVWVDDTVSIVWWGLAAVAVAGTLESRHGKRKSN